MESKPAKAIQIQIFTESTVKFDASSNISEMSSTTKTIFTEFHFLPQQFFSGHYADIIRKAFNNRTRERNYYRLYTSLLEGDISEDDFNSEIDANEDLYVIDCPKQTSKEDIFFSVCVSRGWMDMDTTDEFTSIFEIDSDSVDKYVKLLEE